MRYGYGQIRGSDEPDNYSAHFEFSRELISATNEYYKDNLIYEHGAKGDVLFFGFDSTGIGFGFDKGDKYAIVRVDEYKIVE
ncbi:hypothetical protein HBA92_21205 [Ochrobactrum sp. MR28]|nr:hypothetical protein [Ochrobactrum sp. MR28]MBX8818797.1 hypothetical protein [Ochrobactrum sp. MR31]